MTKIYLDFVRKLLVILAIIVICAISRCEGVISDKRLCYDPQCNVPMSLARTLLRYSSPEPGILSFKTGQNVTVYSKSAGNREDLWGVEINGKRGYAPKSMLREFKAFKSDKTYEVPTEISKTEPESNSSFQQIDNSKINNPEIQNNVDPKSSTPTNEEFLQDVENIHANSAKTNDIETVTKPNIPEPLVSENIQDPGEKFLPHVESVSPSYQVIDGTAIPLPANDVPIAPSHTIPALPQTVIPDEQPILSIHPNLGPNIKPFISTFSQVNHPPPIQETLAPEIDDLPENDTDESKSKQESVTLRDAQVQNNNFEDNANFQAPETTAKNNIENEAMQMVHNESVDNLPEAANAITEIPESGTVTEKIAGPNDTQQNVNVVVDSESIIASPNTPENIDKISNINNDIEKTDVPFNTDSTLGVDKTVDGTKSQDGETPTLNTDTPTSNTLPSKISEEKKSQEPVVYPDVMVESNTIPHISESILDSDKTIGSTDWWPNTQSSLDDSNPELGTNTQDEKNTDILKTDDNTAQDSPDLNKTIDQPTIIPESTESNDSNADSDASGRTATWDSTIIPDGNVTTGEQSIDNEVPAGPVSTANPLIEILDSSQNHDNFNSNQVNEIPSSNEPDNGGILTTNTELPPIADMKFDYQVSDEEFQSMFEEELRKAQKELNLDVSSEPADGHLNAHAPDNTEYNNLVTQPSQEDLKDYSSKQYLHGDIPYDMNSQHTLADVTDNPGNQYLQENITDDSMVDYSQADETNNLATNAFQEHTTIPQPITESVNDDIEMIQGNEIDDSIGNDPYSNTYTEAYESISDVDSNDLSHLTHSMSTEESQNQPVSDDVCGANSDCLSENDAGIHSAPETGTDSENWDLSMISIEERDCWQTLLYLVVTAVTTLLFSLGYYYIESRTRDGALIAKINKLEKELLVTTKENVLLDEGLKTTKNKLNSIEDESFGSNEMVLSLKSELEASEAAKGELEDQIVGLEKELETATEAGLELERMLREFLSSQSDENPLAQSVEDLQTRLNVQQATTESLTKSLNFKTQENETLSAELVINQDKCRQLEMEVTNLTEELKTLTNSKNSQEKELSDKVHLLTKQVTNISEERDALISELAVKKMELKDLTEIVEQQGTNNLDFKKLFEVSHVKAEVKLLAAERDELKSKYQELSGAHQLLEEHMKLIQEEISSLTEQYELAERDKTEAQTRLEVLSNYFKEKESQLQKELGMQEALWVQKQGEVTSTVDRIQTMQNEIQNYRQQIETLKREILDQEREYKSQISALETKTHEQWVIARQSERRLEESKAEASQLRNRLTLVEKSINEVDVDSKLHRMETNGETAASPLFMGGETSSSPIIFTGSSGVPPLPPSYMYGNPLPPPFIPPPPGGGAYDISRRPPPLGGRLSSPPPLPLHHLPSRFDDGSSPPPLSPPLHAPYNHCSPPPFSNDRIHPPPPPFLPPMGSSHSWGDEPLPPLRNSVFHPQQREQRMRNHKGSLHSSGDSLDKSHQSGKV